MIHFDLKSGLPVYIHEYHQITADADKLIGLTIRGFDMFDDDMLGYIKVTSNYDAIINDIKNLTDYDEVIKYCKEYHQNV